MGNKLPAFIMTDCTLAVPGAGGNRIGQVSEITIPVMEKTIETFRNGGMIKPREVAMGYEITTASFKETALDPDMLQLYGFGNAESIIAYGSMRSEDGTEHAARFEMVCDVKSVDMGNWASAQKGEVSYGLSVHSGILYIDDAEVYAFDDFGVRVGGVEQFPGRRAALRLD